MLDGDVEMMFTPDGGGAESKRYVVCLSTLQGASVLLVQDLLAKGETVTVARLCAELKLEVLVLKRVLDPLLARGINGPNIPNLLKPVMARGDAAKA